MIEYVQKAGSEKVAAECRQVRMRRPIYARVAFVAMVTLLLVNTLLSIAGSGDDADYEQIVAELSAMLASTPDNVELYRTLGDVHFEHKAYAAALANYQDYLALAEADTFIENRVAFLKAQARTPTD